MAPKQQQRRALAAILVVAMMVGTASHAAAFTLPDQQEKITAFRDAMLARPGQARL